MLQFTFYLWYGLCILTNMLTGLFNEKRSVEFNCLLKDYIIEALELPYELLKI